MNGETIDNTKPKTKFETKLVLITPQMAKATLEHNAKNRRLNPVRVDEFAKIIKDGRWQLTHQGIALDDEGNIIDGQHRLAGIVKANCSVWSLVSKGVPEQTRLVVDTGRSRSTLDISKITGREGDSNLHFAIARILEYGPVKSTQMHLPPQRIFELVDKFRQGVEFATEFGGGIPAPILAVVARAYYSKPHKRLKEFIEVYKSSSAKDEGDTAAIKLRLSITEVKSAGLTSSVQAGGTRKSTKKYIYNISESALTDFLNKYPTKVLKETKQEKFPLPAELGGYY